MSIKEINFKERTVWNKGLKGVNKPNSGSFQEGHKPWNTGTKGIMKPNSGSFKPGQNPKNTLHDGAITLRHRDKRGEKPYYWIRLDIGKWMMYHKYKWEQTHGPTPKGHIIIFKDGNTLNLEDSNLQCISRAENARRNYNSKKAGESRRKLVEIERIRIMYGLGQRTKIPLKV